MSSGGPSPPTLHAISPHVADVDTVGRYGKDTPSMRLAPWLGLLLSSVALAPASARAAEGDLPTTVLGLEALPGVPETVATEITDALRQRVAATKGYQLLQGKDLVEIKLVFACPDEAPACMSQAGKSLGATKLIFGNVKSAGNDYVVTLKLMDVSREVVESFTADTIPNKQAEASTLRSLAPRWMVKLSGKGGGSIQVRANFDGAAVSLDGTKVGVTSRAPVVINDVAPGHHEVAVEKSGYTTTKQEFTLAAGQSLPLDLSLSPVSVEVRRPAPSATTAARLGDREGPSDDDESHALTRVGFWVATVGTIVSAGLALKFGLDVKDVNEKLDQYRRFDCPGSSTGYCDGNGAKDKSPVLSAQELTDVHNLTNDGNRDYIMQWVFVGLTGAFAIAGGVLLYKGFLAADCSASRTGVRLTPSSSLKRRSLSFSPARRRRSRIRCHRTR